MDICRIWKVPSELLPWALSLVGCSARKRTFHVPQWPTLLGLKGPYFIRLGSLLAYLECHLGLLKRSLSRQARCPAITARALASRHWNLPTWRLRQTPSCRRLCHSLLPQQALWITRSQECSLVYTPGVLDSFTDQLNHLELFKWHFEVRYH